MKANVKPQVLMAKIEAMQKVWHKPMQLLIRSIQARTSVHWEMGDASLQTMRNWHSR